MKIGGSIIGGSDLGAGTVQVANVSTLSVGGSIIGGSNSLTGRISALGKIGTITIKGDLFGGSGDDGASIDGGNSATEVIKSISIGGSIVTNGGRITIDGTRIGSIAVKGGIIGSVSDPVRIFVSGLAAPATAAESLALGKVTVGGDVRFTTIAAGLDAVLGGFTPDAAIGTVKIGGSMIASSIAAGIDPVNGKFGDADDKFVGGNVGNAAIIAKIASVTIGGQLLGTAGGAPDTFGILAEQIGALTIGKVKVPLTTAKDDFTLGFTADVRVREL